MATPIRSGEDFDALWESTPADRLTGGGDFDALWDAAGEPVADEAPERPGILSRIRRALSSLQPEDRDYQGHHVIAEQKAARDYAANYIEGPTGRVLRGVSQQEAAGRRERNRERMESARALQEQFRQEARGRIEGPTGSIQRDTTPRTERDPRIAEQSGLGEVVAATGRGVGQIIESAGGFLRMATETGALPVPEGIDPGGAIERVGQTVLQHPALQPSDAAGDRIFDPKNPHWWLARAPEQVPQIVLAVGGALASGGLGPLAQFAAFASPTFVQEAGAAYQQGYRMLKERGFSDAEAAQGASGVSVLTGAGAAVLERIPFAALILNRVPGADRIFAQAFSSRLANNMLARQGARAVTAGGAEMVQEIGQEAWGDVLAYVSRIDPQAFQDWQQRYAASGAIGLVVGASTGAATGSAAGAVTEPPPPAERPVAPEPEAERPSLRRRIAETLAPELRQERDEARREAETDPLTGLGNRRAFDRALETAEADEGTAVVIFDVENLKALNDKRGDEAGDAAIRRAADAIRAVTPRGFRHGGDELAAIVPAAEAEQLAAQVREAFGEEDVEGFPVRLRAGIGQTRAEADAQVRAAKAARQGPAYRGAAQGTPGIAASVMELPVEEIDIEPERFQFKLDVGRRGVGRELESVRKWDPNLAGLMLVWQDPADGRYKIVNGHHRLDLAKRLGVENVAVRVIDAEDAQQARTIGALANIAEGRGTAIDAAKLFRDEGITPADLEERGISMRGAVAREGLALANLPQSLFADVVAGRLPVQRAVVIGGSGLTEAQQLSLADMIRRRGRSLTNDQLSELVRFVRGAGETSVSQETLFGEEQLTQSLAPPKAQLSAAIKERLARDRRLFGFLVRGGRASRIEQAGVGHIQTQAAETMAEAAAQAEEVYNRLSIMAGPISEALNEGAAQLAQGGNRNEIVEAIYGRIRSAIDAELRTLTGTQGADAGRVPPDDRGRRGADVGREADPAEAEGTPAEVDPAQGALLELTAQDDLFGGPTEFAGEAQGQLFAEPERQTLSGAERQARATVDRLRPFIERNRATPEQREQYREALALLRRGEAQSEEETRLRSTGEQQDPGDTGELFGPMLDAPVADIDAEASRPAASTATLTNPPMSGRSVEVAGRVLHPIAPVELARIASQLLGGTGTTRVFMKRFPGARGAFYPDPSFPRIALNPTLGQDYDQFARTLAHEVGHLIDFLPDLDINRGNILGRLATLKSYLAATIDRLPSDPTRALTPEDRKRIRRAAEKRVGPRPPKDEVADLAAWRAEVSAVYAELIEEEIAARDLLTREQVHEELHTLSMWWRPYTPGVNENYDRYRQSSPEIYADAMSVLLNDPAALQERAPIFFESFLAYMDRKPDVLAAYESVQALIGENEDALMQARREELERDFERGEELLREAEERPNPQSIGSYLKQLFVSRGAPLTDAERKRVGKVPAHSEKRAVRMALQEFQHADNVNRLMLMDITRDVHEPMLKAGISPEQAGRYLMLQRIAEGDRGGMAEQAKEAIMDLTGERTWPEARAAYLRMSENAETAEEFDADLLELAETGVLNPRGYTPAEAKRTLAALERELGEQRFAQLEQLMQRFRAILFRSVETAVAVGSYNTTVFAEKILPNRETYTPFAVLDYFNGRVPAGVKRQIGTLKGIANPYTSALLKAMALNRLNEYQRVKLQILNVLDVDFPGMAGPVQRIDRFHPERRPGPGRENLLFLRDGKLYYREVDAYIAKVLDQQDLGSTERLARLFSTKTYALFHPLYVTWSLGWQVRNIQRDWKRSYKNLSAARAGQPTYRQALGAIMDLAKLNRAYARTMGAAWRNARRQHDPLIRAMLRDRALGRAFHSFEPNAGDAKYERLLQQYGIREPSSKGAKETIRKLGHVIETLGVFQETWSKAAAYEMLGEQGITGRERAYIVRNYIGTPDSTERGLASDAVNGMIMYANVIMAGLRADAEVALQPQTAAGYWLRSVLVDFLPKAIMAAAIASYFGDEIEEWIRKVPSYDLEKYIVVPVPPFWSVNEQGERKAVYLRLPHDDVNRIIAGSVWALLMSDRPHRVSRTLGLVSGEFGGLNPALSLPWAWFQVARGKNPEDTFRGRPIIPQAEWEAGGWQRWKELIRYTMGEFGVASELLGFWTRSSPNDGRTTLGERLLRSIPGVSALVKVSDRGDSERREWEIEWETRERAKIRADLSRDTRRLLGERAALNRLGVQRLDDRERQRRAQLNAWYRLYLMHTAAMERARDTNDRAGYERAKAELERATQEVNARRPTGAARRRAAPAAGAR